ncbi:MAG: ComEC/Rec2 family competence protein [Elusimicrobia bacterium]|nr:ComEC/Rec2 family competence protein [Elusimicrobiota bacterium]
MPLSHARRPLVLLAVSYALGLTLLKCWGAFEPEREAGRSRRGVGERLEARVVSPCLESRLGDAVLLAADTGRAAGERVQTFLPRGSCGRDAALPGDRVAAIGSIRPPRRALMPGDFDEAGLLEARGARFILHARRLEALPGARSPRWLFAAWAERARRSASAAFRRWLAPDDARLLGGLLFGDKSGLDPELARRIRDAGAMHLLVASGTNVAFLMWGAFALLVRAGLSRPAALAPAALAGAFYCLMAGAGAPSLRAYAATCSGLAAFLWPARDAGALQAIAWSGLLLLAVDPTALFSPSFQMTYAAALALWLARPRWRLSAGPRWARACVAIVSATLAVQLALWPCFANVFGRGSLVGLASNVVLVPTSGAYIAGGLALWLVSPWPPLAQPAAAVLTCALGAFKAFCGLCAAVPYAAIDLAPMDRLQVLAWYAGCVAAFLLPRWRPALALSGLAAAILAWRAAAAWAAGPRLEACFVGDRRGYATWARLPGGETLLVDAGLAPARLAAALKELGGPVDRLVLTGGDPRRTRGMAVTRRWPVKRVERVFGPFGLEFGRFLLEFGAADGLATVRRGGGIEFCILRHPAAVAPAECFPAGIRGVGYEGAVWIITDGERYEISSTTARRPLGRPLL